MTRSTILAVLACVVVACSADPDAPAPTIDGNYSFQGTASVLVNQGATATTTITVVKGDGFTSDVALAATGLPSGVTASITRLGSSASDYLVAFTAGASAAIGNTSVTLTGTAPGFTNRTTTLSLKVQAPPPTVPVTIDFCSGSSVPVWVAYLNEGSSWTRLTPDANAAATFGATAKVGLAVTQLQVSRYVTNIYYVTSAELQAASGVTCVSAEPTSNTATATVTNQSASETTVLAFRTNNSTGVSGAAPPVKSMTLAFAPQLPFDVIAMRKPITTAVTPSKIVVRRNLSVPNNGSLALIDYNLAEALTPASATYTTSGLVAGETNTLSLMFTTAPDGLHVPTNLEIWNPAAVGATGAFTAIPAASTIAGDIHDLSLRASATIDASTSSSRTTTQSFQSLANATLVLGPAISVPEYTKLTSTAPIRYRAKIASQPEYGAMLSFDMTQSPSLNIISLRITSAYLGSTPASWDVTIPDFTGMPGWDASWNLKPGVTTSLNVDAYSTVTGLSVNGERIATDGLLTRMAGRRIIGIIP